MEALPTPPKIKLRLIKSVRFHLERKEKSPNGTAIYTYIYRYIF